MLYFPQLSQFPITRRRRTRTVLNESPGGHQYGLVDDAAARVEWRLSFTGLSDGERDALGQFFETAEGRLEDFTFLDPADNLLAWSEDLTNPVWQRNALLQAAGGQLTNAGLAPLRIEQNVSGPGWFRYALSVYARGTGNERIGLYRATQTLEELTVEDVGTAWKRHVLSGQFSTTEEGVRFGLQIEPGQSVEVSGLQVEAQAAASVYKKTGARSGVYGQARFGEDGLDATAEGPSRHSCEARIVSRG